MKQEEQEVSVKIKRALISVSNKIGIVKFAEALQGRAIEIISTGGTYKQLFVGTAC